jgi:general secretion pathway protein D
MEELFPAGEIPTARHRIIADERTNSLVIEAPLARLDEMRRFLTTIDSPARGKGFLHVVRVLNADAEVLAQQLTALQGEGDGPLAGSSFKIVPDAPTNSLVIQALPEAFLALAEVIAELDVIPARIAIEVLVLEVETSRAFELGFDALIPLLLPDEVGDPVGFAKIGSIQQLVSPSATSLPFIARIARAPVSIPIIGPDGLPTQVLVPEGAAQLTAAQADVKITNLMSPFLLAASGKEHRFFAGEQIPLPVSSAPTTGTPATSPGGDFVTSSSIERKDIGVDLRVKPIALSDELVEIELDLSVESVDDISLTARTQIVADKSTASSLGPTLRKIELGATIRLLDGAVVLLAGSPQARVATSEIGVPFLRDIPVLGNFFRSTVELERRTRLVIALQATQMHTPSDERAESIQRRLAMERHLARTAPLLPDVADPYGLLVATRETRSEADGVVQELQGLPGTVRIVEWTWWDSTHYDVYLIGFPELEALGPVSISLRELGFQPKMAVIGETGH